jgi:hypothetical protein
MTMRMQSGSVVMMVALCMGMSAMAQTQTMTHSAMSSSSSSSGGETQMKDDLFAGTEVFAKGASDVTEITMDPDTLGMVGGKDSHKAHNMILNVVRTYEYDKPGMYRMEDVDAIRAKLNTGDWHCSVHTRSLKSGEATDICNKRRTDDLVETAIITVEPKELTFIHTIRKRSEGETGDMSGVLIGPLPKLPALAMLEPDMLQLKLSVKDMKLPNMAEVQAKVDASMASMPDQGELRERLAEAQQQVDAVGEQLKELKLPEMQQKLDDAEKDADTTENTK